MNGKLLDAVGQSWAEARAKRMALEAGADFEFVGYSKPDDGMTAARPADLPPTGMCYVSQTPEDLKRAQESLDRMREIDAADTRTLEEKMAEYRQWRIELARLQEETWDQTIDLLSKIESRSKRGFWGWLFS